MNFGLLLDILPEFPLHEDYLSPSGLLVSLSLLIILLLDGLLLNHASGRVKHLPLDPPLLLAWQRLRHLVHPAHAVQEHAQTRDHDRQEGHYG